MKRFMGFFVLVLCLFVLPTQLFAFGGCKVTITNKTGTVLAKMVVVESVSQQRKTRDLFFSLKDDKSTSVTLKENIQYDIYFTDDKGHVYGKKGRKFTGNKAAVNISSLDLIPHDVGDLLKWLLGE